VEVLRVMGTREGMLSNVINSAYPILEVMCYVWLCIDLILILVDYKFVWDYLGGNGWGMNRLYDVNFFPRFNSLDSTFFRPFLFFLFFFVLEIRAIENEHNMDRGRAAISQDSYAEFSQSIPDNDNYVYQNFVFYIFRLS